MKINNFLNFTNSTLITKVIASTFFASCLVFVLSSGITAYTAYQDGQKDIVKQVNNLEQAIANQLESSMWGMDKESIVQILKAISGNPHVATAKIMNYNYDVEAKNNVHEDWMSLDYPMYHRNQEGKEKYLGTLRINLSKERFLNDLQSSIISSVIQNLIRFLAVSFCIIWIINKKIILPIRETQLMTKNFNDEHLTPILGQTVNPEYETGRTEIENLYREIHLLQENFKKAFIVQKQSEEAKFEMEMQLEKERQKVLHAQKLETIGQITAQVAHDFGNLIMIINNKAKSIDKCLINEADKLHTEAIRKATAKAHSLIKRILSMTRVQSAEPQYFDPFQSIFDMQDLLKMSIGPEIILSIETDAKEKVVLVEPSSFENVIINLCVNARDAMPSGGRINISINTLERNREDFIAISVKDNGCGIPEDIQMKIFDPFFTTKGVGKGSGLGLSQVQDFVKNVGGTLELSSCDEGTVFTLYFPNKAFDQLVKAA